MSVYTAQILEHYSRYTFDVAKHVGCLLRSAVHILLQGKSVTQMEFCTIHGTCNINTLKPVPLKRSKYLMFPGKFSTEHAGSATVIQTAVLFVTLYIFISWVIYLLENLSLLWFDTQFLNK
jgi:hypothetical protein